MGLMLSGKLVSWHLFLLWENTKRLQWSAYLFGLACDSFYCQQSFNEI